MPPDNYRVYRLDASGQIHEAEWFNADSDDAAVSQIAIKYPSEIAETRSGSRLIAALRSQSAA